MSVAYSMVKYNVHSDEESWQLYKKRNYYFFLEIKFIQKLLKSIMLTMLPILEKSEIFTCVITFYVPLIFTN
jgi:hypothetical protein